MKISTHEDLFGETELWLESLYLDEPIKGLGSSWEAARADFEQRVVIEMRTTLSKLRTVYQKTKYQFNPLDCKQVLLVLENTLKSTNRRTSIPKLQVRLTAVFGDLELVLPNPKAKSYPSQLKKINLIGAFIDFDFTPWTTPNIKITQ